MYAFILQAHAYLRYFILIMIIVVIVKSLMGWINKKPFGLIDDKFSLYLFIFTHLQLLAGLILYFISPWVEFSGAAMKDPLKRYWLVEHNSIMLIAIVLITVARISSKKMTSDQAKHKRLFIFNTLALVLIVLAISMSKRGIL